jgi:hypothetical protein
VALSLERVNSGTLDCAWLTPYVMCLNCVIGCEYVVAIN